MLKTINATFSAVCIIYWTVHSTVWILLLVLYNREYKIEVRDSSFQPQIMVIEEGDRIWWEWTKDKVGSVGLTVEINRGTFSQNISASKIFSVEMACCICVGVGDFFTCYALYRLMLLI